MNLMHLLENIKKHPDFHQAGMILCHNGVVRGTDRAGKAVTGIRLQVDQTRLTEVLTRYRNTPGILDIQVQIAADRDLRVGEDVMYLIVAGDIRENVIRTLENVLNEIKTSVTSKTQYYA